MSGDHDTSATAETAAVAPEGPAAPAPAQGPRAELLVGTAFAGGLVAALILKGLGRERD
ncbi:MAG TPA: hypothetical protein VHB30_10375 [Solirubrobacteraceae bacterium]|nr:hypothetical protein [Solirubrobacteraceae bacterium]